ncbi:MAG: hypothetical protein IPL40_15695 [Proteobacteria bacterium]|nr:hypothetical protein [Pseudomonadota bacterium]
MKSSTVGMHPFVAGIAVAAAALCACGESYREIPLERGPFGWLGDGGLAFPSEPGAGGGEDPLHPSDVLYQCSRSASRIDLTPGRALRSVIALSLDCEGQPYARSALALGPAYRTARLDGALALVNIAETSSVDFIADLSDAAPYLGAVHRVDPLLHPLRYASHASDRDPWLDPWLGPWLSWGSPLEWTLTAEDFSATGPCISAQISGTTEIYRASRNEVCAVHGTLILAPWPILQAGGAAGDDPAAGADAGVAAGADAAHRPCAADERASVVSEGRSEATARQQGEEGENGNGRGPARCRGVHRPWHADHAR